MAKRLGGDVTPEDSRTNPYNHFSGRTATCSATSRRRATPRGRLDKWPMDMPGFYYYPDVPGRSSNQPVVAAPHLRAPAGVKWVTFGGTNELLSDWMGCDAEKTIPVKFNGKAVGVWEVSRRHGRWPGRRHPPAGSGVRHRGRLQHRRAT